MSKIKGPAVPEVIEILTKPVVIEPEYVCTKLAIQIEVYRFEGKRSTGQWSTQEPLVLMADTEGDKPFCLPVHNAIEAVIKSIKEAVANGAEQMPEQVQLTVVTGGKESTEASVN